MKVMTAITAPCADICALPARSKPGIPDVVFIGPTRGAVQVFCILHQLARAAIRHHEEDGNTAERADQHHHFADEQRLPNTLVLGGGVVPPPGHTVKGLIDGTSLRSEYRVLQSG